jgi:ABC-type uncharacterized transport system auxiliary subunit
MRWLACLILCLNLSGCFSGGKRGGDSPLAVYDFGPAAASLRAVPRKQPVALEVRAPLWFDSQGIDYRLAYEDAARQREYARTRWAGPPVQLIQQRLIQQLGLSMAGQSQARCLLRIEIAEFSQVFATADASRGVLQGRVVLLDRSRQQLAELVLNLEKPSPSPDARGGVTALTGAVDQLAADLADWEGTLLKAGNPGDCFG